MLFLFWPFLFSVKLVQRLLILSKIISVCQFFRFQAILLDEPSKPIANKCSLKKKQNLLVAVQEKPNDEFIKLEIQHYSPNNFYSNVLSIIACIYQRNRLHACIISLLYYNSTYFSANSRTKKMPRISVTIIKRICSPKNL